MLYPRSQLSLKDRNFHERSREEEKVGKSTYLLGAWWSEAEKDVRAKGGMESRDSSIHFTTQGEGRRHQDFLPISDICTLSLLQDVKMWNMWNLSQISHSDYFPKPHPPSTHNVLWALTTMDYHWFPTCHALTRNRVLCVMSLPACHLLLSAPGRLLLISFKPTERSSFLWNLLSLPVHSCYRFPQLFSIYTTHISLVALTTFYLHCFPLWTVLHLGVPSVFARWWGEWR